MIYMSLHIIYIYMQTYIHIYFSKHCFRVASEASRCRLSQDCTAPSAKRIQSHIRILAADIFLSFGLRVLGGFGLRGFEGLEVQRFRGLGV